jgi:hypothetical protein
MIMSGLQLVTHVSQEHGVTRRNNEKHGSHGHACLGRVAIETVPAIDRAGRLEAGVSERGGAHILVQKER